MGLMDKRSELFINRLNTLLEKHGAVSDFCRKSGFSRKGVDQWLSGTSSPSLENLYRIAETLGLSVEDLLKEAPITPPKQDPEASMLLELLKNFSPMKRELIGVISALGDDRLKHLLAEAHALKKDAP